jgi:hypothetical protein
VPDENDRRGTLAIFTNRMIGDQTADRELVNIGRDTRLFDPLGQAIYPSREERTEGAAEQIGASVKLDCWASGARRGRGSLA